MGDYWGKSLVACISYMVESITLYVRNYQGTIDIEKNLCLSFPIDLNYVHNQYKTFS